jgi:hypothetical protein
MQEGKPPYDGFSVDRGPMRKHENTYLVTTFREWRASVLYRHSEGLWDAHEQRKHRLYIMPEKNRQLRLDHRLGRDIQKEIEMPHEYLREHSWKTLQIE